MTETTAGRTFDGHKAGGLDQKSLVGIHIFTLGGGMSLHSQCITFEETPSLQRLQKGISVVLSCTGFSSTYGEETFEAIRKHGKFGWRHLHFGVMHGHSRDVGVVHGHLREVAAEELLAHVRPVVLVSEASSSKQSAVVVVEAPTLSASHSGQIW